MATRAWWSRSAVAAMGFAMSLLVGCASQQGGSPLAVPDTASGAAAIRSPSTDTLSTPSAGGVRGSSADPASTAEPPAVPAATMPPGMWSAVVRNGPAQGILSPTADLTATLIGSSVCFAPDGGVGGCGSLAPGVSPTFASFSPDGSHLLVVAGQPGAVGAYVVDVADASVKVLGPAGVQDFSVAAAPPLWDLSTASWNVDGSAVLLVPRTDEATGPVLAFELGSGTVGELIRIDAELANSTPSIWSTMTGIALVANTGEQRNILWWGDFASGSVTELANYPSPGGSIALTAADPDGRSVLICPRQPDGALGATNAVVVQQPAPTGQQAVKLLPDSMSCAGSVFSADGRYLAVTAKVDDVYRVIVIDRTSGAAVLHSPLPVTTPSAPPYLTWLGDVIVANDVSGQWPTPSLLIRLTR